jgi:hypothetical protein
MLVPDAGGAQVIMDVKVGNPAIAVAEELFAQIAACKGPSLNSVSRAGSGTVTCASPGIPAEQQLAGPKASALGPAQAKPKAAAATAGDAGENASAAFNNL